MDIISIPWCIYLTYSQTNTLYLLEIPTFQVDTTTETDHLNSVVMRETYPICAATACKTSPGKLSLGRTARGLDADPKLISETQGSSKVRQTSTISLCAPELPWFPTSELRLEFTYSTWSIDEMERVDYTWNWRAAKALRQKKSKN